MVFLFSEQNSEKLHHNLQQRDPIDRGWVIPSLPAHGTPPSIVYLRPCAFGSFSSPARSAGSRYCRFHLTLPLREASPRTRAARSLKIETLIRETSGRLRLKMQKIHRVNLVRLNLLKSREIIERHWIGPRRNRPGPYKKKIWRRLRERLSRAARRLEEDSLEIHSPAVESIHSHWIRIDSTWFSSFIERPWIDSTHKIQRIQV